MPPSALCFHQGPDWLQPHPAPQPPSCNNLRLEPSLWQPPTPAVTSPAMDLTSVSDLLRRCSASANLDATPYAIGVMHSLVQREDISGPCRHQTNTHYQNIFPQHGSHGQESKQQLWAQQSCNTSTLQQPADHNLLLMDTSLPLFAPAQKVHFFPTLDFNQHQPQHQQKQSPDSSQESAWAPFREEPRSAPTRSSHPSQTDVMYLPVSKVVRGDGRRSLLSSEGRQQQQPQPPKDNQPHLEHQPRQEQQPKLVSHLSQDMSWDHPTLPQVPTRIRHWATRRAADVVQCDRTPDREDVIRAIKAAAAEAPQWRARFAASFNPDFACEEPVSSTRQVLQPVLAATQLPEISFWPVQHSKNDLQAALATVVPCVPSSTAAASAISSCTFQPNYPSCSLPSSNVCGAQHVYAFSLQQPARRSCIPHSEVVITAPLLCTTAFPSDVEASIDRTLCVIDMNSRSFSDASPGIIPACKHLVPAQKPLPAGKDVPVLSSPDQRALSLAASSEILHNSMNPGISSPRQEDAPFCQQDRLLQPDACIRSAANPLAPAKPSAKGSRGHATSPFATEATRIDQQLPAKDAAPMQRRRRDVRAEDDEDYEAPAQRNSSGVSSKPRVRGPVASRVKAPRASSCKATCIGPAGEVSPCIRYAVVAPVSAVCLIMQQGEQKADVRPGEYAARSGHGVAVASSADECMDAAIGAAQGLHKASHSSRGEGKSLKLAVAFKEDDVDSNNTDSDSDRKAPAKVRKTAGQKQQRAPGEEEQPKASKSMRSKE